MADLTWEVSGITYCGGNGSGGWVNVSPSSGFVDENTTLTISVKQSSGGTGDCSAANVVITASTGDIQEIPVTRCLRECNCESMKIEASSVSKIPNSGKTNIQLGTYDANCTCADPNMLKVKGDSVLTNVRASGGNILGDVGRNCEDIEKTGTCEVYINNHLCHTFTVTQQEVTYTYREGATENVITGVTASAITSTDFGCSEGPYKASGTSHYDKYTTYECWDSCGVRHSDKDRREKTGSGSDSLGSLSGSFKSIDCCQGGGTNSATLKFESGEYKAEVTFNQSCPDCRPCGSCYISGPEILECEGTADYDIITS